MAALRLALGLILVIGGLMGTLKLEGTANWVVGAIIAAGSGLRYLLARYERQHRQPERAAEPRR